VIVFATILVMLAAAVVLLAVARSLRLPYPALLTLAGAVVAVAPVDISLRLDPELALALFIAPVLLDAAGKRALAGRQFAVVRRKCLTGSAKSLTEGFAHGPVLAIERPSLSVRTL
jgi:hypothetical protein